jgi:hypothetical protein
MLMNATPTDDATLELHIRLYDELTALVDELTSINLRAQDQVDNSVARVGELLDLLKRAHASGLLIKATDLSKRHRDRLGFVAQLCEDSIDKKDVNLLRAAVAMANFTYIEDERYHELHYCVAIIRYCARKLGVPFSDLAENPPWGLTPEVKVRFDDIGSRPFRGLLDSFELEVTKKNGRTWFQQRR